MDAIFAIARLTLMEARASKLPWVGLAVLVAAAGAGEFAARLALAEAAQVRLATAAAMVRPCLVGLLAIFITSSVQRERQEGHWRFLFARPARRHGYVFAKGLAIGALALTAAATAGLLVWVLGGPAGALRCLRWAALLWAEATITSLFALACAISFVHAVPAVAATAAFYLLARSSVAPFDLLVPRLDLFARAEWLLYPDPVPFGWLAMQTMVAVIVLGALACADLQRRAL